jgi:hypothetical protein
MRRIRHRVTPRLLLLAFIACQASFIEGAVSQWSSIYAAGSLGLASASAAAVYTTYAVVVAVTRLRDDWLAEGLGRRRLLRLSALAAGLVRWPRRPGCTRPPCSAGSRCSGWASPVSPRRPSRWRATSPG